MLHTSLGGKACVSARVCGASLSLLRSDPRRCYSCPPRRLARRARSVFACVVRPVPTPMVFAAVFGVPGQKTRECSPARGAFRQRIVSGVDDGPVRVSGLNKGVESLKAALDEAEEQIPDVVAALKTAGMLCVRVKRTNPNSFSNHGWGSALDLFSDEQPIESSHLGVHAGASGNQ
jgi:hypothetical protein